MKNNLLLIFICLSTSLFSQKLEHNIQNIAGQWTGSLTYLDFQDDLSESTLNCFMEAKWKGRKGTIKIGFEEPNGKIYSDKLKIEVSKKGNRIKFDGAKYKVVDFTIHDQTTHWTLVMEATGKDNRKLASIQQTIKFTGKALSIIKEIKYQDAHKYFVRNKYDFMREQ